ncbi:2Fe-2S iron-sulfur cluster-binding protein [Anabaena azotica]|uniref:2Fe-2S iron-sulfur cluster-binding protein n=1 Tax=Anabaena azotica TaxID=197653 RepID=UPI0039A5E8E3
MSTTYAVEINHQGKIYNLQVPENETILAVAEAAGLEMPASCHAGVCTTCAALITEGMVDQSEGMGVGLDLQKEGYALLCVSKPLSNLKIETEKEDIVYQKQFGKE